MAKAAFQRDAIHASRLSDSDEMLLVRSISFQFDLLSTPARERLLQILQGKSQHPEISTFSLLESREVELVIEEAHQAIKVHRVDLIRCMFSRARHAVPLRNTGGR